MTDRHAETGFEWLNYHHLFYFWTIAEEGGIAPAGRRLRLSHSTLHAQLKALEGFLGGPLFQRQGRRLVETALGAEVHAYATQIFRLGGELVDVARGRSAARRLAPLRIGVLAGLPRTIVYRLLEPAITGEADSWVIRQDRLEVLVYELAAHRIDVVISDALPPLSTPIKIHAHLLGDTDILFCGTDELRRRHTGRFPRMLDRAPVLLPSGGTALGPALRRWFVEQAVSPHVVGELDDAGLLRTFGGYGHGFFPVRSALEVEVEEMFGARAVGAPEGLRERYFLLSLERKVTMPAVARLIAHARERLASAGGDGPRRSRRATAPSRRHR